MQIPAGWRETTVGSVSNFISGFPFGSAFFSETGIRLVRGSNVKRSMLDWNPVLTKYWVESDSSLRAVALADGDIVVAMDGALVGRSFARISKTDLPAYLVQRVARLRGTSVDQDLLYAWIKSDAFANHVDSVKTHTAIPHISPRDIRSFAISVPESVTEQKVIANAISDVDSLVSAIERLIAKKTAIRKGMMQQLLTGMARIPGFTSPWVTCPIMDLADQYRGVVIPNSQPYAIFQHFSLPAFDSGKMPAFDRGSSIESNKFRVPHGSVLLSKLNPRIPRVWAPSEVHENAISSTEFIVLLPKTSTNRSFLRWLLQSESVTGRMALLATGTTGSHQRMHPRQVAQLEVGVPSEIKEQSAIASALDDAEQSIELLRIQLAKARNVRAGMMQELLTGKTRLAFKTVAG